MRFKILDFLSYYKTGACAYSVHIYVKPLTESDYKTIVEKFKYHCRRDGVSWLTVFSTTESESAEQTTIKTGKAGRPKKQVKGKKIDGHIHNVLLGSAKLSARKTALALKKSIDKKAAKKVCKVEHIGDGLHFYNTVKYNLKQADIVRTGGAFDFKGYVESHKGYG